MKVVKLTIVLFLADPQGRRYSDVVNDPRLRKIFGKWLDFFNDPTRQQKLQYAEMDYLKPALAGVIRELETPGGVFETFLANNDAHTTQRARQAIGVIVKIIMEGHGWHTTGRKGSLGQRVAVHPGTTAPGAYRNRKQSGLSDWFKSAEHYQPPTGQVYGRPLK